MRRVLLGAALAGALMTTTGGAAAAEKPEPLTFDFRYVTVVHDVNDAFVTGNDRWFHTHDVDLGMAGAGTIGGEHYLSDAAGSAHSHTSMADDPALPPGAGDEGNIHIARGSATFDPTAGGARVTCGGWVHLTRVPADPPFHSSSEGDFHWKCDNGWDLRGTVDAHFELDPALGIPVFALYFSGEAR